MHCLSVYMYIGSPDRLVCVQFGIVSWVRGLFLLKEAEDRAGDGESGREIQTARRG